MNIYFKELKENETIKILKEGFQELFNEKEITQEKIISKFIDIQKKNNSILWPYQIDFKGRYNSISYNVDIVLKEKLNKDFSINIVTLHFDIEAKIIELFSVFLDNKNFLDKSIILSYIISNNKMLYNIKNIKNENFKIYNVGNDIKFKDNPLSTYNNESKEFKDFMHFGDFLNREKSLIYFDYILLGKELTKESNEMILLNEDINLIKFKDNFIDLKNIINGSKKKKKEKKND